MEKQKQKQVLKQNSNTSDLANTTLGNITGADISSEEKNSEHAPITITIPVTQQATANANPPQNAPPPFRSGNRRRGRGCFFSKGGRRDFDTGAGRSHTKQSGEFDAYCMDVAPIEYFQKPSGCHGIT